MTNINLLPWRELKREQEKKIFTTLLLTVGVTAIVAILMVNYYASSLVGDQTARNKRLQDEITIFDNDIADIKALKDIRTGLISRMRIVYSLQARRTLTVHFFDELIKILPDGVYLTEVKRVKDTITVKGYSESNTNVSLLMRNIQKNPWIQQPVLTDIKKADNNAETAASNKTVSNEFNLSFILKPKILPVTKP